MSGDNPVDLISSLNRAYLYLLAFNARNGFVAIVADDGTGHYALISDAVTAGEKYIFVKNGAYTETADIVLEGVSIIGQSAQGVVVTLTDATFKFQDNDNSTVAGTVRPTNNDKTIVGAGTTFTTVTGDTNKYLWAERFLAEIDTVSDATNMELLAKYFGSSIDQGGAVYALPHGTFSNDSVGTSIENMTIIHLLTGADTAIELQGIRNRVKNVQFKNINNSSTFITSARSAAEIGLYCEISECRFEGGTIGIKVFNSNYLTIEGCTFFGQEDSGIELTVNATGTKIKNCQFTGLNEGIVTSGAATETVIEGCLFAYTASYAIIMNNAAANLHSKIINCEFTECFPATQTILLDCGAVSVKGCHFNESKVFIAINDGQDLDISDNYFENFGTAAIDLANGGTHRRYTIKGNHLFAEAAETDTEAGMDLWGENHVVANNTFRNIETWAVGFNCNRSVLADNTFNNCDISNINVVGSYNSITGNVIEDSTDAIVILGHENVVTGNVVKDDLGTALLVSTGDRNIISCNRIENPITNGIQIDINSDRCVITNNITLNAGGVNFVNNGTNTSVGNNIVA